VLAIEQTADPAVAMSGQAQSSTQTVPNKKGQPGMFVLTHGLKTDGIFSLPFRFVYYIFLSVFVFMRSCFRIYRSKK
jgi:hypothetical protein